MLKHTGYLALLADPPTFGREPHSGFAKPELCFPDELQLVKRLPIGRRSCRIPKVERPNIVQ